MYLQCNLLDGNHRSWFFFFFLLQVASSQSRLCRTSCGGIPIAYPFSIDHGCGNPRYRHLLLCSSSALHLRTPSGKYPVVDVSYSPTSSHLLVSDPSMFNGSSCGSNDNSIISRPTTAFALDTSTPLSLSLENTFLFLNCSPSSVLVGPRLDSCRQYPGRCSSSSGGGSICDSTAGSQLCRGLPDCQGAVGTCCEYFPEASESIRTMLRRCKSYTSVYWRRRAAGDADEVAEFGTVRVDFEVPARERCGRCEDRRNGGGGTCGFDTGTHGFLCLCRGRNVSTHCGDAGGSGKSVDVGAVVGTTTAVSVAGLASAGAVVCFLRKLRANRVACGVQTSDNRLF